MRDDNRTDVKPDAAEGVNQAESVKIVCDAEVASYLVLFNVVCGDDDDYFRAILEFEQHFDLRIGQETRKDARRVEIVKQLAAEFKIELASERSDTVTNVCDCI